MRSLRERQREERAALILDAAREVFAEKGFHDASIDEIAAVAGVAKGTVYLHFASKEELLIALVERQVNEFLVNVDQVIDMEQPVRPRLEQILLHAYSGMQERRNRVLLELTNGTTVASSVIEKRPELRPHLVRAMERITSLLEEGKRTGELDRTVPTPVLVATFQSLLSPSSYEHLLRSGQVSPTELVSYVSRIFFPGPIPATEE